VCLRRDGRRLCRAGRYPRRIRAISPLASSVVCVGIADGSGHVGICHTTVLPIWWWLHGASKIALDVFNTPREKSGSAAEGSVIMSMSWMTDEGPKIRKVLQRNLFLILTFLACTTQPGLAHCPTSASNDVICCSPEGWCWLVCDIHETLLCAVFVFILSCCLRPRFVVHLLIIER
jgi:hypothetical protein